MSTVTAILLFLGAFVASGIYMLWNALRGQAENKALKELNKTIDAQKAAVTEQEKTSADSLDEYLSLKAKYVPPKDGKGNA